MAAPDRASLTRFAHLSIAAAVATMVLKAAAYWMTGSIGLLSDAAESLVNLAGAIVASIMLAVAARPPDDDHAYGHSKAEYFSSVFEGMLIIAAALGIAFAAIERLLRPQALGHLRLGILVTIAALAINLIVGIIIQRAGRLHRSISLEANAAHLFADVWTSAGVIVGISLVMFTGWQWLDPVVALIVVVNIIFTGFRIVMKSMSGLMDSAWPAEEQQTLNATLAGFSSSGARFHAVRTRQSGPRRFVSMHVLVPGDWTVQAGHQLLEHIEAAVRDEFELVSVFTHLEPLDDPASFADQSLDRDSSRS